MIMDGGVVLVSWLCSRLLAHPRNPWQVLDQPNARSLHARPVPRMGGLAIAAGALMGFCADSWQWSRGLAVAMTALAVVAVLSWYDDQAGLSPRLRLLVHVAAAALVAVLVQPSPGDLLPGLAVVPGGFLAILFVTGFLVWWINLYNFMDGMDGFAGGMAVFGFGALAALAYRAHDVPYAEASLTVAAAALGFTVSNFPPARLFMGDVGATALGFGAGMMILAGDARGDFPTWAGLIVFSPFLVDATLTLVRRVARGENPTVAHREHYYQRLVQAGLSQRRTVLGEYALMAVCAVAAYAAVGVPVPWQWVILASLAVTYTALAAWVGRWEGHGQARRNPAR